MDILKFILSIFKRDDNKIEQKGKGLIPSPSDPRDYALSSVSPIIQRYPESVPTPFDLTTSNQESNPSCVGHTAAGIKQYFELREKISKTFDGEWIYKECKKIDGIPNFPGTYLRTGLEVLKKIGAKPLDEQDPSPYKISFYARNEDNSFEGLKKAIFLYGIVWAGFRGSNQGWREEIVKPPKSEETLWAHSVRLVSYEKDYLIGQNSWGELAHNKGYFKVPANYSPFESWVVISDALTNLKPQPIKTAWVVSNWIKEIGGVFKTTTTLNAREGAGTNFKIVKVILNGTILNLTNSPRQSANGYVWVEIIL